MKYYEFGKKENPVIFLFPGTCCHWKANFGEVIPLLESSFYVVCVSYDGFDETEDTIFPDMITGMPRKGKILGFMTKKLEKTPQEEQDYMKKMLKLFGMGTPKKPGL